MEIFNLGMTGQAIKDLLGTVQSNAESWSQGATQALRYTVQTLGPDQQIQARSNIDAQKKILQYVACTATTTTTTYTGFAIGAMGADMSTTTNFGVVFGVPNFWDTTSFEEGDTEVSPRAPGFGAIAFGAGVAEGKYSVAMGGGNSTYNAATASAAEKWWNQLCPSGWKNTAHSIYLEYSSITKGEFPTTPIAHGKYAVAMNTHTLSLGGDGFAEGFCTINRSPQGHVEGRLTLAAGGQNLGSNGQLDTTETNFSYGQHAEGRFTAVWKGAGAHVEGNENLLKSALGGHLEGNNNILNSGQGAHLEGSNNILNSGKGAHGEGYYVQVTSDGAHGGGEHTYVTGAAAFAHGYGVKNGNIIQIPGQWSIPTTVLTLMTEGSQYGTLASGTGAIAMGVRALALGQNSISLGQETRATNYQVVVGKDNYALPNSSAFIVGIGTGDSLANRKNGFVVNTNGAVYASKFFANYTGATLSNSDDNELATHLWVNNQNYITDTVLVNQLQNYYTKGTIDSLLTSYVPKSELKPILVWKNTNPSASIGSTSDTPLAYTEKTDIDINLLQRYQHIMCRWRLTNTGIIYMYSIANTIGTNNLPNTEQVMVTSVKGYSDGTPIRRWFKPFADASSPTQFSFSGCNTGTTSSGTTANNCLIPTHIWLIP